MTSSLLVEAGFFEEQIDPQFQSCKALWIEVMRVAITDATNVSHRGRHDRNDARLWINSVSDKVGSFVWICGLAGLDPQRVRNELQAKIEESDRKRKEALWKRRKSTTPESAGLAA